MPNFSACPDFKGEAYVRTVTAFLHEKYAADPPDVIIVAGEDALLFMLRNRATLFPRAPLVHAGVSASFLRSLPALPADVVGTPLEYDSVRIIELAFRLRPNASRLVLVTGSSEWDKRWEARLRSEVPQFPARAKPEFLAGLPTEALRNRLAELGDDAVVFTPGYFADGDGRIFTPRDAAEIVAAASAAPVYGPLTSFIGAGVVGGYTPNFLAEGQQAGRTAIALLDGAAPASLRMPEITPLALNLDWRQVRRWGLDESAIPGDAIAQFREPTLLEAYRTEVIVASVVFLFLVGLIVSLLVERRLRHRTAGALAESEARMNLATRAAGLSTWVWDVARGRIAATGRSRRRDNPLIERAIDVSRLLEMVHPADRERVEQAMLNASTKGTEVDVEYRMIRPDGEVRWIAARGRGEKGNGQRLLGVALDVTDRKNAELQAERDRVALQHMTRVSILGQLSASIAHQLNQPLAAIRANAEAARKMLGRERVDHAELRDICDDIVTEDRRAADVIARLRGLFRRGELHLQPLDLNELVHETLGFARVELEMRHVAPILELAPSLPAVNGDRVQLQQMLLNLIVNASRTRWPTGRSRTATHDPHGRRRRRSSPVCVEDRGPGIAQDDLKRVFEPFWSTKSGGMGMGLAICQSIVAAHGGTLTVDNNPHGGAIFCATLPARASS